MPRARGRLASTATRTPRIVTTRTPLFDEAGWRVKETDLRRMRSGIFLPRNLDDPNHVEMAGEIRFCAQRVLQLFGRAAAWSRAETFSDLPDRANGQQSDNDPARQNLKSNVRPSLRATHPIDPLR